MEEKVVLRRGLRSLLIVVTGLLIIVCFRVVSLYIPGTPSHTALRLLQTGGTTSATFLLSGESALWFRAAVLSGLAGIVIGLSLRWFSWWDKGALTWALVGLAAITVLMNGPKEMAAWCGAILLVFGVLGGLGSLVGGGPQGGGNGASNV